MRRMRPVDLALGAAVLVFATAAASRAERIASARMPNRVVPQAEISLLRLGDEMIVRSVIHTRFPSRVRDNIAGKEAKNWGDHADAATYRAALAEAFTEYGRRRDAKTADALVIDFIAGPASARVAVAFAFLEADGKTWEPRDAATWRVVDLSREYIEGNQVFILEDALGKDAESAVRTLREARVGSQDVAP